MKYGHDTDAIKMLEVASGSELIRETPMPEAEVSQDLPALNDSTDEEMYFDYETMRWKTRQVRPRSLVSSSIISDKNIYMASDDGVTFGTNTLSQEITSEPVNGDAIAAKSQNKSDEIYFLSIPPSIKA